MFPFFHGFVDQSEACMYEEWKGSFWSSIRPTACDFVGACARITPIVWVPWLIFCVCVNTWLLNFCLSLDLCVCVCVAIACFLTKLCVRACVRASMRACVRITYLSLLLLLSSLVVLSLLLLLVLFVAFLVLVWAIVLALCTHRGYHILPCSHVQHVAMLVPCFSNCAPMVSPATPSLFLYCISAKGNSGQGS